MKTEGKDVYSDSDALTVGQTLRALRRRMWLIVLSGLVVAVSAFFFSKLEQERFTATAVLRFNQPPVSKNQAAALAKPFGEIPRRTESATEMALQDSALTRTADLVGGGLTASAVREMLDVHDQSDLRLVNVSAKSRSAIFAARVANTYTGVIVLHQNRVNRENLRYGLSLVRTQLTDASPDDSVDGALGRRKRLLLTLSRDHYGDVDLVAKAGVPLSPSSPRIGQNALIGLVVGILLGIGLALVIALREDRDAWAQSGGVAAIRISEVK